MISGSVDLIAARRSVPTLAVTTASAKSESAAFVTMDGLVLIVQLRIAQGIARDTEFAIMVPVGATTLGQGLTALVRLVRVFALVVESAMVTLELVNVFENGWVLTARPQGTTRTPTVPRSVPTNVWNTARECFSRAFMKDAHAT